MVTKFTFNTLILLFCCFNVNAQFLKNFDFEVTVGWMQNYNKGKILSAESGMPVPHRVTKIVSENSIRTTRTSFSIGYTFSKSYLRIKFTEGIVGSRLSGSTRFNNAAGNETSRIFDNLPNLISYHSIGIHYGFLFPIDNDYFIFEIGASRHKLKSFDSPILYAGILLSDYNISTSLGFIHSMFKHIDIVPRITAINSFAKKRFYRSKSESKFVPFQIGFELGLRLRI